MKQLNRFIIGFLGVALFVAIVNLAIDPMHFFGTPTKVTENGIKPNSAQQKSYIFNSMTSKDVFIFGTSRAERGLDTNSIAFGSEQKSAHNFALAGISILELSNILYTVSSELTDKDIIIGLDYFSFSRKNHLRKDVEESLFNRDNNRVLQIVKSTLSIQAFSYSLTQMLSEGLSDDLYKLRTGFYRHTNDPNYSYSVAYKKTLGNYMSSADGSLCYSSEMELLELAVGLLLTNNNTVKLYISPEHALMRHALYKLDQAEQYDGWRLSLVELIERIKKALPEKQLNLWDFSKISKITSEVENSGLALGTYYWEPSHFKPLVGDMILNRLMGHDKREFGVEINADNIYSHIAEDQRNLEKVVTLEPYRKLIDNTYLITTKRRFIARKKSNCGYPVESDFITNMPRTVKLSEADIYRYLDFDNGWYPKESWGIWSNGPTSKIRLILPKGKDFTRLEIRGVSYAERVSSLYINGRFIASIRLTPSNTYFVELDKIATTEGKLTLEFRQTINGNSKVKTETIAIGITELSVR